MAGWRRRKALWSLAAALLALFLPAAAQVQEASPKARPTVVFMSDFGTLDDSVAICKGVMYSIAPELRIVDLTHQVTPFSILNGARFLYGATPYYPAGTVFAAVVDPGVGSTRKAVVVKSRKGQYFVLPDNGLMTLVEERDGVESVREIINPAWMIGGKLSSTFHGRDIFSPVAAHLARGEDWTQVGPEVKELVRLKLKAATVDDAGLKGEVIAVDGPFGNLITNVDADLFSKLGYKLGDMVRFRIGPHAIAAPWVKTFSDVAVGKPLLYLDSRGHLGFSVNQASAQKVYNIQPPIEIVIPRKAQ